MRTNPNDFQSDLARFVSYIGDTPFVSEYVNDCVAQHTPEGFDAKEEVAAVRENMGRAVFGPFCGSDEEETAEITLILRELVSQGVSGRSRVFYGYSGGSAKFQDMIDGFLNRVVRILIDHLEGHLVSKGIAMGLDDKNVSVVVDMSGASNSLLNIATGGSSISAVQQNGQNQALESLLQDLISSTEGLDDDVREAVEVNAQVIRDEHASSSPRKEVLEAAVKSLKVILGGTHALASLMTIAQFLGLVV